MNAFLVTKQNKVPRAVLHCLDRNKPGFLYMTDKRASVVTKHNKMLSSLFLQTPVHVHGCDQRAFVREAAENKLAVLSLL
jgi:hypothetical protein